MFKGGALQSSNPFGLFDNVISDQAFNAFQQYMRDKCGIAIGHSKRYMVQSRLDNILRETAISNVNDLIEALIKNTLPQKTKTRIIDAITTNETYWFRDGRQFDVLTKEILPELAKHPFNSLRIWSAGCSYGQEPYSICIAMQEFARLHMIKLPKLQIIGTDLSHKVLDIARQAVYSEYALSRGLPTPLKQRYFVSSEQGWKLKPEITSKVSFRPFNLLNSFSLMGKFDVIFCRNVLIYFSSEVKLHILNRMIASLKPKGSLFLSSTESLPPGLSGLKTLQGHGTRYYRRMD